MPEISKMPTAAENDAKVRAILAAKHDGDFAKVTVFELEAQVAKPQSAEYGAASERLLQASTRRTLDGVKVITLELWYKSWVKDGRDPNVIQLDDSSITIRTQDGV